MTSVPRSEVVDTRAIIDLANGVAVVGYALFAYQQPGSLNDLQPIQPVDMETPVSEIVARAVAARAVAPEPTITTVETVVEADVVVEDVAAVAEAETVVEDVATVAEAESVVEEVYEGYRPTVVEVFPDEVSASAPTPAPAPVQTLDSGITWDPEVWKPASEKEPDPVVVEEQPVKEEVATDTSGYLTDADVARQKAEDAARREGRQTSLPAGNGPVAPRSTVSMLQDLSFLDE